MNQLAVQVSREGINIKQKPQQKIEVGCIFRYGGSQSRLKYYLLVHKVNPEFSHLKDDNGKPLIADDMVVVEALRPDNGYADYCVFWVEKNSLRVPTVEQYAQILGAVKRNKD
jgi:hypothetical protein